MPRTAGASAVGGAAGGATGGVGGRPWDAVPYPVSDASTDGPGAATGEFTRRVAPLIKYGPLL